MLTSTSNSSSRRPEKLWRRSWVLAVVFSIVILVIWEHFNVKSNLWKIGTNDSEILWSEKRILASQLGANSIILLGASRIQLGVDVSLLEQLTGKNVVQLAIDGNPYMSIFEDLANDESIIGTVIIATNVTGLVKGSNSKNRASKYLNYYRSITNDLYRFDTIEALLSSSVKRYSMALSGFVTPYKWFFWPEDRLHQAGYLTFNSDRSVDADYSKVDIDLVYRNRVDRHLGSVKQVSFKKISGFKAKLLQVNHLVAKIKERGGRVVFVRFPTSKRIWEIDEVRYPKEVYWDVFSELSIARAEHFKDFESLSGFDLPDGSHLDQKNKVEFTENLAKIFF